MSRGLQDEGRVEPVFTTKQERTESILAAARMRLAEAQGRLSQAGSYKGDPEEYAYFSNEAGKRLSEAIETILDYLEEVEEDG